MGCLPLHHYYLRDYLGNNRDVYRSDGNAAWTPVQRTEYTPFGLSFPQMVGDAGAQPYKFGGKELDRMHGLNIYDFVARQYDPYGLGFWQVDPLCTEKTTLIEKILILLIAGLPQTQNHTQSPKSSIFVQEDF